MFEDDMPFSGIREAKKRLELLRERHSRIRKQIQKLIDEFLSYYPHETTRVRLSRNTDRSLTALRWRIVSHGGGLYQDKKDSIGRRIKNIGERIELYKPEGQVFLNQLTPDARKIFLDFEYRRIHLNYLLSTTTYEIGRLEIFIEMFDAWREMKKQETKKKDADSDP